MSDTLTVRVVGAREDERYLSEIASLLRERGITVETDPTAVVDAVVVAISADLVRDTALLDRLRQATSEKYVPVRVGPVHDTQVPAFLSELNWILWDSADVDPGERIAALLTALRMDLGRYRDSQSLEAQAGAWAASGHEPDYLMSDRRAVARARASLGTDGAGGSDRPLDPTVDAFLEESHRANRRAWWRRNGRWAFRVAALFAVIAIVVTGVRAISDLKSSNVLAAGLLGVGNDEGRPDLQALKMAGLIDQQLSAGRDVPQSAYGKLISVMAPSWGLGVLGYGIEEHLNGFALTTDPNVALTADSLGTVGIWDLSKGAMTSRFRVSAQPLYGIAATPDGTRVATYDAENVVRLTDRGTQQTAAGTLSFAPEQVVIAGDGTAILASGEGGELYRLEPSSRAELSAHSLGKFDAVLGLRAGSGGEMWAIVRKGNDLILIDGASGRTTERWARPASPLELAAVSPSGRVVVVADDDGALFRNDGTQLRSMGATLPRGGNVLTVDDAGIVIGASLIAGTQVVDVAGGRTSRVCPTFDSVSVLALSPDGRRMVCGGVGVGELVDLTGTVSTSEAPADLTGAVGRTVSHAGTEVTVDGRGQVRIQRGRYFVELDPDATRLLTGAGSQVPWVAGKLFGAGRPALAAVTPDGHTVAVATDAGVVTEIDISDEGRIAIASRHDFGPSAVTQIRWSGDGSLLWAQSTSRRWTSAPACPGCGNSLNVLFGKVRDRVWFCYPSDTLAVFTKQTIRDFGLQECPSPAEVPA